MEQHLYLKEFRPLARGVTETEEETDDCELILERLSLEMFLPSKFSAISSPATSLIAMLSPEATFELFL